MTRLLTHHEGPNPNDPWAGNWVTSWTCACGVEGPGGLAWLASAAQHLIDAHGAPAVDNSTVRCPCGWRPQPGRRSVAYHRADHHGHHAFWLVTSWDTAPESERNTPT